MPEQTNVRQNLDVLVDEALILKDLVTTTVSGAGEVDAVAKIFDTGGGFFEGGLLVDVTSIDITDGDEEYNIHVQGSSSPTFASGLASVVKFELGDATQIVSDVDIGTGRYIIPFNNQVDGTIYRYLRVFHDHESFGTGILTLSANVSDTDTVTTGTKVYTFQTVLTNTDGNVLIGASASDSIDNLIAAINLGAGSGTTYAASTSANTFMAAAVGTGDTMGVIDTLKNQANATTKNSATASWGAATTVLNTELTYSAYMSL